MAALPLRSIHPKGWLREQLEIQAKGLGGHIEEVWKDLGPDNGWRGGSGESWERGPYYLDGLVPLAFLLEDPVLLGRMQVWMDWNLEHQGQDGSIGPRRAQDWWPDMVFLKVLSQYAEGSGDPRALEAFERYAAYLKRELPGRRLNAWQSSQRYDERRKGVEDLVGPSDRWQYYRWMEMSLNLLWLHQRSPDPGLLALARDLKDQGYDWEYHFKEFKYKAKTKRDEVYLANHGVNNAMGLKVPALNWLLSGDARSRSAAKSSFETLQRYHGQPNGAFSADEQLAGVSPSQGTELCTVAEEMFSLEMVYAITGETWAAEAVERLAYNAWPATFDELMWTHQYDQQANQVLVSNAPRAWSNNGPKANLFGLEPEWGCCTANFHQGWPKFARSLWMATQDAGLQALSYAPCEVHVLLAEGQDLRLEVEGGYPFAGEVTLSIRLDRPASFALNLPVPSWARNAVLDGPDGKHSLTAGSVFRLAREWKDGDQVRMNLPLEARARAWGDGVIVERGPLLLALDLAYETRALGDEPWSDKELIPTEAWNWGLSLKPGAVLPEALQVSRKKFTQVYDRRETPVRLKVAARRVENWALEENSAGPIPKQPQWGESRTLELIPYGAAKLRVSVFPGMR